MTTKYNSFLIQRGNYDWMHPDEEQTQVIFRLRDDAPFEKKQFGIVVSSFDYDEDDFDTVWGCAYDLNRIVQKYLVNSDKLIMAKLVPYLESLLFYDKLESLLDEKSYLLERIRHLDIRIISVEQEIEEAKQ